MNTLKYFFLSFLMSLLISKAASAQNSNRISGKVINEQGKGLEDAIINLLHAKDSSLVKLVLSDFAGEYTFENIKNGQYFVTASMLGARTVMSASFSINETNKDIVVPSLTLNYENQLLEEITVIAQKPFVERKADKLIVNVEGRASTAGNTALEVLQKAPGVTIDANDNISMNGKNGVLVLLDNKPTYMSSADLANLLKSMQSNEIESIELIANPSARYDASGNAGIINIKTKNNNTLGFNGTLTAGVGYGETSKLNGGTNLNFRKGKVNIFGNYNYGNRGDVSSLIFRRIIPDQGIINYLNQDSRWDRRRFSNSYKVGIDYSISNKSTIGLLLNGYYNPTNELNNVQTTILNKLQILTNSVGVDGALKENYSNNTFNLNYKTTFDSLGKEFSFDLDRSIYNGQMNQFRNHLYVNSFEIENRPPRMIRNFALSDIDVWAAKMDYTHPINKNLKVELGWKSSWVTTDNDLQFDTLQDNNWVADEGLTNHFLYNENIHAGYLNVNKIIKNTTLQVGLRGEYTRSTGNSITLNNIVEREYLKVFPSFALTHTFKNEQQIGLTYSRRIDRPSYDNLNPFVYILDDYTYEQGNPYLNPQFTHAAELSYSFKSIITGFSYNQTSDIMSSVYDQNNTTKVLISTPVNLNKRTTYTFKIYAPFPLTKWWNISNNMQVFNTRIQSEQLLESNLDVNQTVFQVSTDHQIMINKTTSADLFFFYTSPWRFGILRLKLYPGLNIGFKKTFMDERMSVKVNVSDIFNTQKQRGYTDYAGINNNFLVEWETRVLNFSITYRFGNNKLKSERNRSTAVDAETSRMKK